MWVSCQGGITLNVPPSHDVDEDDDLSLRRMMMTMVMMIMMMMMIKTKDDDDQVHGRRGGERDEGRLGSSQHHQASVTLTSRTQGNLANGILSSL